MKIPLIAPFAAVSLFLAACGQKPSEITSSVPAPSSTAPESSLAESSEPSENSEAVSSSLAASSPATEPGPSASQIVTSVPRPVFKSEAATQAANQYLDSYAAVINDVNAAPQTRTTDPQAGLNNVKNQLQKLSRDSAALANQQSEVQRQLTPIEQKRLRQYQKNLEQQGQE